VRAYLTAFRYDCELLVAVSSPTQCGNRASKNGTSHSCGIVSIRCVVFCRYTFAASGEQRTDVYAPAYLCSANIACSQEHTLPSKDTAAAGTLEHRQGTDMSSSPRPTQCTSLESIWGLRWHGPWDVHMRRTQLYLRLLHPGQRAIRRRQCWQLCEPAKPRSQISSRDSWTNVPA
jgi:hypothetical protein